jgi:phytoene/squalene synthetase
MSARLKLYDRVAEESASIVIRQYSTSFSAASRLLGADVRQHVDNIYALVRIADEIVDGAAAEAGLDLIATTRQLNELERETEHAIEFGFSSNLIVHAFALTARDVSFGAELTAPFFESMRMDLSQKIHDQASFERYVHGSAEVVGLMCLCAFLHGHDVSVEQRTKFEHGARALGSAFQKVNFLRDLADDFESLGRSYFPGIDVATFTESEKVRLLDDLDADLRDAAIGSELPASSKRAVALAHSLFAQLSKRIRATPASELVRTRVRVPDVVKLRLAAAAAIGVSPRL